MKNIKKFIPFLLLVLALGFNACSSENEEFQAEPTQAEKILDNFYSKSYEIGNAANVGLEKFNYDLVQKSVQIDDYQVTEVFVGNDPIARGYLFENVNTNEIETFVDVDRNNYILTSVDIETNDVETTNNINQLTEYNDTNGFDLIGTINNDDAQNQTNGWRYELVEPCHAEYVDGEFIGFYETINVRRYALGFIRTYQALNQLVPCGTYGFLTN